MKSSFWAVTTVALTFGLTACGNDDGMNGMNNGPGIICPDPTFTAIYDDVLSKAPGCATDGCHGGRIVSGALSFSEGKDEAYRQLTEDVVIKRGSFQSRRIVPNNLGASFLYIRLVGTSTAGAMPPAGAPPDCQVQAVADWIDAGAAND
jgi:hypothetical protein